MRTLIVFLIVLFAFTSFAFAEYYAVEKPDGRVSILYKIPGSNKSLEMGVNQLGFSGYPIKRIELSDLPAREDRAYWTLNDIPIGKKVVVEQAKKNQALADEQSQKAEEDQVLAKLGISRTEYKKLRSVQ